jgi:hypothetical protein
MDSAVNTRFGGIYWAFFKDFLQIFILQKYHPITNFVILQPLSGQWVLLNKTPVFAPRKNAHFLQFAAKRAIRETSSLRIPFSYVNIN